MPIIVVPLAINVLILTATWMSQLTMAFKVLITTIVVIKFALYFYSSFICDIEWLKVCSFVVIPLFNAVLVALGVIYNIMDLVISPILLVVMYLIWMVLPRTIVSQEKEGSR